MDPVAKDLSGMSTIHAASMGHQLEVVKVGHTHTHMHLRPVDSRKTHTHTRVLITHTLSLKHSTKTMVILLHFFAVVGEEDWFQALLRRPKMEPLLYTLQLVRNSLHFTHFK